MKSNRREFLTKLFSIVSFMPFVGVSSSCKKESISIKEEEPGNNCLTTTDDILGPFYRENAPQRSELNINAINSDTLRINGNVYSGDCKTPLNNALIDIWHANDKGEYDNDSSNFEFRGVTHSGANGEYEFATIVPGRYLNGSTYRPSHIHLRITADGHKELVTQLYFKDDPFIASDPWASDKKAEKRIIELQENDDGEKHGVFDIYMSAQ